MSTSAHPRPAGKAENGWRNQITKDGEFPAEAGRYLLYIAYACPFAHRTLVARGLKGLEDAIPLVVVHPVKARPREDKEYEGWEFRKDDAYPEAMEDPIFGVRYVQDFYEKHGDFDGAFSVPILYDTKTKKIVNNESAEIVRIFDSAFDAFAKRPNVHFSQAELLPQIDEINGWVHPNVFLGALRTGTANTQADYDQGIAKVEAAVNKAEDILSKQRYLAGDTFTEADLRLWVHLIVWDAVLVVAFKLNRVRIADRPNLFNYTKEIYQLPGVKDTVQWPHPFALFKFMKKINPLGIVPAPPKTDFSSEHDRERLPGKPLDA